MNYINFKNLENQEKINMFIYNNIYKRGNIIEKIK